MNRSRMTIAIVLSVCMTGCTACREITFRDGTAMVVEVRGNHHVPFGTPGRIVIRNFSTGEMVVLSEDVCDAGMILSQIERDAAEYSSADEYIKSIKDEGWPWL